MIHTCLKCAQYEWVEPDTSDGHIVEGGKATCMARPEVQNLLQFPFTKTTCSKFTEQ